MVRAAANIRAAMVAPSTASVPTTSNSGSTDSPATNDMTKSGGTSGGRPASSHSTSGTGTGVGAKARSSRTWRSTSRLRTGATPGGATFTTTDRSPRRPA